MSFYFLAWDIVELQSSYRCKMAETAIGPIENSRTRPGLSQPGLINKVGDPVKSILSQPILIMARVWYLLRWNFTNKLNNKITINMK